MPYSFPKNLLVVAAIAQLLITARADAVVIHRHDNSAITWEADGDRGNATSVKHPNNPAMGGAVNPEAGDTQHQHFDMLQFVIANERTNQHSVYAVWDNRTHYDLSATPYPVLPHAYIDESNPNNVPRYRFVGANWENGEAAMALPQIRQAFEAYSAMQAGMNSNNVPLFTGLEFARVGPSDAAEIDILWGGLPEDVPGRTLWDAPNANTGVTGTVTVRFSSDADFWSFGMQANTPANRVHFYSTALHEIGHVVGLDHVSDMADVMITTRMEGPNNPPNSGPAFDALTMRARRAASALYSIPVPEPASVVLLAFGVGAMMLNRRASTTRRCRPRRSQILPPNAVAADGLA